MELIFLLDMTAAHTSQCQLPMYTCVLMKKWHVHVSTYIWHKLTSSLTFSHTHLCMFIYVYHDITVPPRVHVQNVCYTPTQWLRGQWATCRDVYVAQRPYLYFFLAWSKSTCVLEHTLEKHLELASYAWRSEIYDRYFLRSACATVLCLGLSIGAMYMYRLG